MTRRDSAASSRSSSSARAGRSAQGPRVRSDGKVDIFCPQCGAQYRVPEDLLDQKMTCKDCERTFFPKATGGKRAKPKDNTKAYVGFGVAAVAIVAIFVISRSGGGEAPRKAPVVVEDTSAKGGMDLRAEAVVKWAQRAGAGDVFGLKQYTDFGAIHKQLEVFPDKDYKNSSGKEREDFDLAIIAAFGKHESTRWFRELSFTSGNIIDATTNTTGGQVMLFGTPKPGDDNYIFNTRAEVVATFRLDGNDVKVTAFEVKHKPARNPKKPDPNRDSTSFKPNEVIAAREAKEITDSAGTRKVYESKPAPVPHWADATPAMREQVDKIVADIVASADPEAPGTLFNRATAQVKFNDLPLKKAVVPRILNAMYEAYGDVNGNNMKLSQLNKALVGMTGFAVNYDVRGTGDAAKDKVMRESCVRQWFAYWWRYANGEMNEFFDMRENPEDPLDENPDPAKKK